MKMERTKQPIPPANSQEDPQLWDLLGKSTHAAAPDDFLSKVMIQVDELKAGGRPQSSRGPRGLAERWDALVDTVLGLGGNSGIRLVGALAVVTVVCALGVTPMLTPAHSGKVNNGTHSGDRGIDLTSHRIASPAPRDQYAYQDAEMQTILQLDDYVAFADQQAFLDTDSAGFAR